jgi:hypothetical protein
MDDDITKAKYETLNYPMKFSFKKDGEVFGNRKERWY